MSITIGTYTIKNIPSFFSFTGKKGKREKKYEKTNHLGNVSVVVSDRKVPVDEDNDGTVDGYRAEVVSATDYYPGGMLMSGRSFNSTNYSFGFNGMLKVDEISGSGNHYTAPFWEYDARLGGNGRWNIDPNFKQYPGWSPYVTFFDNPIWFTDPLGNVPTNYEDEKGNLIAKTNDGSDDVVTITDDKLKGFKASWEGTSETARNSPEMNASWKEYSGNNIKSDKLDPSTLGKNYFNMNYPGKDNPQTYPDAKGKRKFDYSAGDKNLAGFPAKVHDKSYDKLGITGASGLLTDTRAIGADLRFVKNEFQMGNISMMTGDYSTAIKSYGFGIGLGILAAPKTILQLAKPAGMMEIMIWDKVSQPTK